MKKLFLGLTLLLSFTVFAQEQEGYLYQEEYLYDEPESNLYGGKPPEDYTAEELVEQISGTYLYDYDENEIASCKLNLEIDKQGNYQFKLNDETKYTGRIKPFIGENYASEVYVGFNDSIWSTYSDHGILLSNYEYFQGCERDIYMEKVGGQDTITKIFAKSLQEHNYQYPSYEAFVQKIKYYFNCDVGSDKDDVSVLRGNSFLQAIKSLPALYIENMDHFSLYHYNNFIFHNDKDSFLWLQQNRRYLIIYLVEKVGFDKRDDILKFVFENHDFTDKEATRILIFDRIKIENSNEWSYYYSIKSNLIRKIRELKYDNSTGDFLDHEVLAEAFYQLLSEVIEEIAELPDGYIDSDYTIAFLLNEIALSGTTGHIESFYKNYPDYKDELEKNDFYGLEDIKYYTKFVYRESGSCGYYNKPGEGIIYCISDADGYTNLRKEKNTSSEILQQIKDGEEIELLDSSGVWYLVKTNEGKTGYIHKSRIISSEYGYED